MTDSPAQYGAPLQPGDPTHLGDHQLLARLGEGGMGRVYLGRAPDGRLVAVKVIRADLADATFRERFRREAARARQVPPFCTAEVIDAEPDHDPPYLVVEYVEGPDLGTVVREQGPLSPGNVHALAIGVATALTAIHDAGVIHRDLKPSNVLLAPGSPKVIDFGLARQVDAATTELTAAHELVGTVAYMAPERLSGAEPTPAVDVFAWGGVVAYAATGRNPFAGDTMPSLAAQILTDGPDLAGVPANLRPLVADALAKQPADRPTPRELLDRLLSGDAAGSAASTTAVLESGRRQAVTDLETAAVPTRGTPPRRRRAAAVLASLLLVALVAGGLTAAFAAGHLPWLAAATPSVTPSASGPAPAPLPTGLVPVVDDDLADPGAGWHDHTDPEQQATCTLDGGLTAHSDDGKSYRCPHNQPSTLRDMAVYVDVTLVEPGSCASIWFRFRVRDGGYALRVCEDGFRLVTHGVPEPHQVTTLHTIPDRLALNRSVRVGIVADGGDMRFFRDGQEIGQWVHHDFTQGEVALGLLQMRPEHQPPYTVRFADVEIWGRG